MSKILKVTLYPPPGTYTGQGQSVSYDQQEFEVDDTFEFEVLDGTEWFQFEDVAGTEMAIPVRTIAGLALREKR